MALHRLLGDPEYARDLLVAGALAYESSDLRLAARQQAEPAIHPRRCRSRGAGSREQLGEEPADDAALGPDFAVLDGFERGFKHPPVDVPGAVAACARAQDVDAFAVVGQAGEGDDLGAGA